MAKSTTTRPKRTTKKNEAPQLIIGNDGLPEPRLETSIEDHFKKSFACICPICQFDEAKLQLTKKGTYLVQCKECKILLYLNHNLSISLFRGLQNLLSTEVEVRDNLMKLIVDSIPPDTKSG